MSRAILQVPLASVLSALIDYRGKTPTKSSSGVKLITAKVIKGGRIEDGNHEFIAEADYDRWMRRGLPQERDILITTEAPLGEVAMLRTGEKVALAQRVILLRANRQLADQDYLFQALKSPLVQARLYARGTGTTVLGIKQSELRQVELPMPPLVTQRRIGSILAAYDDLIENNTRRIAILQESARRIYEEWFVRFRFPGHVVVRMVESELGLVPEGWPITRLGVLLSVDKGLSYKGAGLTGTGVPMVNLKNILPGGGFRRDGTKPYSGDYKPRHVVRAGDIVVANTDLTQAGTVVGSPAIVPDMGLGECIFSHHIYAVRLQAALAPNRTFIYWLLAHDSFKSFAKGHAVGTTVLGMPKEGVTSFCFARPPEELMRRFSSLASPSHDLAETLHAKNANLRATRDLLLPKLISGALDVSAMPEPEALAA